MAGSSPIIVGGGIQTGSPFTLGELLYVSNVSPPSLTTFPPKHALDGVVEYLSVPNSAGVYPAAAGATETLRILGGMIVEGTGTDTVQIGRAAVAIGPHSTVIGSTATDGSQVGVVVGFGASQVASAGVAVGIAALVSGTAGGSTGIAIGPARRP